MAQIFPTELLPHIKNDRLKSAEIKVYNALKEQLGPEYCVFYNARLLGRRPNSLTDNADGEADFIIAHAKKGILVLEVKGGRIEIGDGQWYSIDRHDRKWKIKNPIDQASDNKYLLKNTLLRIEDWPRQYMDFGHAAIFPDLGNPGIPLGLHVPQDIVLFAEDLNRIGLKIESIFEFYRKSGPGDAGLRVLKKAIAPTISIRRSMAADLELVKKEVVTLTEKQYKLLDFIESHPKVLIKGGAGTGKTFLAMEKARRLAEVGYSVLFTCFSPALAAYIRTRVPESKNLLVKSFHQLCREWGQAAGIAMPNENEVSRQELITMLPDTLLAATSSIPQRFDAILVDEGQDFHGDWWAALELLLKDGEETYLYIFLDENQLVHGLSKDLPAGLQSFTLNENLRNARPIHETARKFFSGKSLQSAGPPQGKVEYVQASSENIQRKIADKVAELVGGGIKPGDIAILSGLPFDKSSLTRLEKIGDLPTTRTPDVLPTAVLVDSISRFKGLESPVVILAELDDICKAGSLSLDKLYVGMTRAIARLIIMGNDSVLKVCGRS